MSKSNRHSPWLAIEKFRSRRQFLQRALIVSGAALGATGWSRPAWSELGSSDEFPEKLVITGQPKHRGLTYGRAFGAKIKEFLQREILTAFVGKPTTRDEMLRYSAACAKVIRTHCPIIFEELEGMADGSGVELDELVLMTLHEELYHRGVLPPVPHCTAVAVGPPVTGRATFVGQTWDWMQSVYGLSSVCEWRRDEGPSLLAYGFPGLWVGAGMNSAGIALCWTSADLGKPNQQVRVGLPSYIFLAHLLYQESLDAVIREAKKDQHAGWFTFVMADGDGRLLNVEGSPRGIAVEEAKGKLVRIGFGTREMSGTPLGQPIPQHARCQKMLDHLNGEKGLITREQMQNFFADPGCGISVGKPTIDMMVYDCSAKQAWLSRGPSYRTFWKRFEFGES
jgi:hypothetical protein